MSLRSSSKLEILSIAEGLAVGDSLAGLVCPKCKGGRSGEVSFGVTRERHGVLFNCHRNSCSYRGFVATAGWSSDYQSSGERSTKHRPYTKPTVSLGEEEYEFFRERFELTPELIDYAGWRLNPEDGRVVMPVRNSNGYDIGCTARSYSPTTTKKSIAYPDDTKRPWLCYYNQVPDSTAVIVEDQVSALKLSQFLPAVALLGTGLNEQKAVDIASSFTNVFWWLDADAAETAYKHRENFNLMFGNFIVFSGSKTDPKDTSLVNINNILIKYKLI